MRMQRDRFIFRVKELIESANSFSVDITISMENDNRKLRRLRPFVDLDGNRVVKMKRPVAFWLNRQNGFVVRHVIQRESNLRCIDGVRYTKSADNIDRNICRTVSKKIMLPIGKVRAGNACREHGAND